jgi:hypothetical protein
MSVRVDYLHTPAVLPQQVDPQIRNFLSQMTLELRGWSDEVVRALNMLLLAFPQLPTDPVAPVDGQVWYNTTTHEFKGYRNGTVVTFVVS